MFLLPGPWWHWVALGAGMKGDRPGEEGEREPPARQ